MSQGKTRLPERPAELGRFGVAGCVVDVRTNRVAKGPVVHVLEPRVMQVLAALAASPQDTVTRDALLREVWGGLHVGDEALSRCISILRKVFDDDARTPHVIETISKIGYRLMVGVECLDDRPSDEAPGEPLPVKTTGELPQPPPRRWLAASATTLACGETTGDAWDETVSLIERHFGAVGVRESHKESRHWRHRSLRRQIELTAVSLGPSDARRLLRIDLRDPTIPGEVVLAAVAVTAVVFAVMGSGMPWMFGVSVALSAALVVTVLAFERIKRRLGKQQRQLLALLHAIAPVGVNS